MSAREKRPFGLDNGKCTEMMKIAAASSFFWKLNAHMHHAVVLVTCICVLVATCMGIFIYVGRKRTFNSLPSQHKHTTGGQAHHRPRAAPSCSSPARPTQASFISFYDRQSHSMPSPPSPLRPPHRRRLCPQQQRPGTGMSAPPSLFLLLPPLLLLLLLLPHHTNAFPFGGGLNVGKILGPGNAGAWDDYKVSGPVVRQAPDGAWNMWYYGRSKAFNQTADLINLPSGHIGLAQSKDGLRDFARVKGPLLDGAVFGPSSSSNSSSSSSSSSFDSLHVGIGDVQWDAQQKKWVMYFFGGDGEYGPTPYGQARGIYMKIGKAESSDGVTWTRTPGLLLNKGAPGEFDALFVGWPQVVDLEKDNVLPGAKLGMFYHTFDTATFGFEIGLATSADVKGEKWTKRGPVQLPRGPPGTLRDLGHATRCVIPDPAGRKKLLMFAECANMQNSNCIAVYGSDDGMSWEDMHPEGKPVFVGAGKGTGRWDAQALGCPSVSVRDGCFYMYYVGFTESISEGAALGCIGLAVSEGMDFTKWRRMGE